MSKLTCKSPWTFISTFEDTEHSTSIHYLHLKYFFSIFNWHILYCVASVTSVTNNLRSSQPYLKSQVINLAFPLSQNSAEKKDIIASDCK